MLFKGMIKPGFKILVFAAVLLVCFKCRAQLSIGNEGIFIKNGTSFSTDSMMLAPAVDMELRDLLIKKQGVSAVLPGSAGFHYAFSSPISFSGKIGILLPGSAEAADIAFAAENFEAEDFYVSDETVIEGGYLTYTVNGISLGVLTAVKPAVLPVHFIHFTAEADNNSARLEWISASEQDNKEYLISRSANGITFTELGRIPGKGSTSEKSIYRFYDTSPLNGSNYYKLEQADYNGEIKELGIRFLSFSLSDLTLTLYPNPAKKQVTVRFGDKQITAVTLSDTNGRLLQQVPVKSMDNMINLSLEDYPAGIYIVRLSGKNGMEVRKVIKL